MVSTWERRQEERAPSSAKLYDRAQRVLAGGMTHDIRHTKPFPVAVAHAQGARKHDTDGNTYIDYVVGHGALLLGHGNLAVVEAVREQVSKGTHYGAAHEIEVEWAELVCSLLPSAERVRFTSSGTEAVMLAVRLARAFTGRPKVVKFEAHFHGWSEIGVVGLVEPFDVPATAGIPASMAADVVAISPDLTRLAEVLSSGDVAAVICEPSGAHFGQVPLPDGFLAAVREGARRHGALLIFDEVITGFRWATGGAQQLLGVTPDLTTMGKVLAGGLPAGAVAGRSDVMAFLELRGDPDWDRYRRLYHPGTFNGNPLAAAAGVAALRQVATGEPVRLANAAAADLREALNSVLQRLGIPGQAYGASSVFHIYLGPQPDPAQRDLAFAAMRGPVGQKLRESMLAEGVDLIVSGGMLSMAHGSAEVEATTGAFERSLTELARVGVLDM